LGLALGLEFNVEPVIGHTGKQAVGFSFDLRKGDFDEQGLHAFLAKSLS
jgi:hypothetical protein